MPRTATALLILVATLGSLLAVALGLHLEPNVASLLPDRGEAAALLRYVRGFGGGDLAVVMVKGPDPNEDAEVARALAAGLRAQTSVKRAADHADLSRPLDPMLAWRYADPAGRRRIEAALTPEGMRSRLRETRALLLAPGSGALAEIVAADPLRLSQLAFERPDLGGGMKTQADGPSRTTTARCGWCWCRRQGSRSAGADAGRSSRTRARSSRRSRRPAPRGDARAHRRARHRRGHRDHAARRDLELSGTLAMVLASVVFVLIFRRMRALVAVMPPLVLGTLWTAGLAAALPGGLSPSPWRSPRWWSGVGVDTGVHVYAALLDARSEGFAPAEAAVEARRRTTRAVMMAAVTAAAAFGALGLSEINAVRQLGLLCGAGEVLTAVAIVRSPPRSAPGSSGATPPRRGALALDGRGRLAHRDPGRAAIMAAWRWRPSRC